MTRREFLPVASALWQTAQSQSDSAFELRGDRCQAVFSREGDLRSFRSHGVELVRGSFGAAHLRLHCRQTAVCNNPLSVRREGSRLIFQYAVEVPAGLNVTFTAELVDLGTATALRQDIEIRASSPFGSDLIVQAPRHLLLPSVKRSVFLPLKQGIGRRKLIRGLDNEDDYVYPLAGTCGGRGKPQVLAIPLIDEYSDSAAVQLATFTDPYFTSLIRPPYGDQMGQIQWIYPAAPGLEGGVERRTIWTLPHTGGPKAAIDAFYQLALAGIRPSPAWTHEIAMVDYDYLSKNGDGWFADILQLERLIPAPERHKVLLALHGWYDSVGRYSYDARRRKLAEHWIGFPTAREPQVQGLAESLEPGFLPLYRQTPGYRWPRSSVRGLRPVPLNLADIHRRIRFAKDRGFRVILYFAHGLAACDGLKDIYDPAKVLIRGGWEGPDMVGKAYTQNPLHPEVRSFFKNYLEALLDEYGTEIDGLVWDETSTVRLGAKGPEPYTGYADRAMMLLARELGMTVASRGDLALFASDNIGFMSDSSMAPYALMLHGNFQDSHFRPEAWPYTFFPNLRNVSWSCNWAPVSNFEYMKYAVENFDAPVGISNGAFGDDRGVSEMSPAELGRIMELFNARKDRKQELRWVEADAQGFHYGGRAIDARYRIFD